MSDDARIPNADNAPINADEPTLTRVDSMPTASDTPLPDDPVTARMAEWFESRGNSQIDGISTHGATDSTDVDPDQPQKPPPGPPQPAGPGQTPYGVPNTPGQPLQPTEPVEPTEPPESPGEGEPTPPETEPSGQTLRVEYAPGEHVDLTTDEALRLMTLAGWAQALPDETRQAFAAIEGGQAVAIPRDEYQSFLAWRQSRGASAAPATAASPGSPDLSEIDPDIAAYIGSLNDRLSRVESQPPPAAVAAAQQRVAQEQQYVEATAAQTVAAFAQAHQLSEDEGNALYDSALAAGIIPGLAQQSMVVSPTGQVIRPPDVAAVLTQALNFALAQDPALHTRTLAPAGSHVSPTSAPAGAPDPVLAKKARSASLASAPSAAITTPQRDVSKLSPVEQRQGMAEMIREAQAAANA